MPGNVTSLIFSCVDGKHGDLPQGSVSAAQIHVIMSVVQPYAQQIYPDVHPIVLLGKLASRCSSIPGVVIPNAIHYPHHISWLSYDRVSLSTSILVVGEPIDDVHKSGKVVVEEVVLLPV